MKTPTYEEAVNILFPHCDVLADPNGDGVFFVDGEPLGLDAVAEAWKGLEDDKWHWQRTELHFVAIRGHQEVFVVVPTTGNMLHDWTILAAMAKEASA